MAPPQNKGAFKGCDMYKFVRRKFSTWKKVELTADSNQELPAAQKKTTLPD